MTRRMAGRHGQYAMQKTHGEGMKGKKRQAEVQKVTGGQNQSASSRKVGKVGAQEEEKRANENKSDGKTMHCKNSRVGVYLMHLHFGDAEIAKQGEEHLVQGLRGGSGGTGI